VNRVTDPAGNRPEPHIAWILGSPRSGSTWLLRMLAYEQRVVAIDEPLFGLHAAPYIENGLAPIPGFTFPNITTNAEHAGRTDYCLSTEYEEAWRPPLRALIVSRVRAQADRVARGRGVVDPITVLKEPNSSHAAELLLSLVPESRLIFLLRDGRDVIDSLLDAFTGDTWWTSTYGGFGDQDERWRLGMIRHQARFWLYKTEAVERAFAAHAVDRRLLVKYEELLASPVETFGELARWIGLPMTEGRAREVVAAQEFSRVPPNERGSGKFLRAAEPGLWRENMSAAEQRLVNDLLGKKLGELGYQL